MSILLFADDPGSVNYLGQIAKHLHSIQLQYLFLTSRIDVLEEYSTLRLALVDKQNLDRYLNGITIAIIGSSENRECLGLGIIKKCRAGHIPVVSVVDSHVNAKYRFKGLSDNPLTYKPDLLFVPDELSRVIFTKIGFEPEKIFTVGYCPLSMGMNLFTSIGHLTHDQFIMPKIVFLSEPSDGFNSNDYRRSDDYLLHGTTGSLLRTNIVLEELIYALIKSNYYENKELGLHLRLHPKDCVDNYRYLREFFSEITQGGSPTEVICSSNLVVGLTTHLLNQACWSGKCCLSIVPRREEKEWLVTTQTNQTPCLSRREDICLFIQAFLSGFTGRSPHINTLGINTIFNPATFVSELIAKHGLFTQE